MHGGRRQPHTSSGRVGSRTRRKGAIHCALPTRERQRRSCASHMCGKGGAAHEAECPSQAQLTEATIAGHLMGKTAPYYHHRKRFIKPPLQQAGGGARGSALDPSHRKGQRAAIGAERGAAHDYWSWGEVEFKSGKRQGRLGTAMNDKQPHVWQRHYWDDPNRAGSQARSILGSNWDATAAGLERPPSKEVTSTRHRGSPEAARCVGDNTSGLLLLLRVTAKHTRTKQTGQATLCARQGDGSAVSRCSPATRPQPLFSFPPRSGPPALPCRL